MNTEYKHRHMSNHSNYTATVDCLKTTVLSFARKDYLFYQNLLFWIFIISIFTLQLGQFFREAGPICAIVVLIHNIIRFPDSVRIKDFPLKPLFAAFYAIILFKTVHSIAPSTSFETVFPNLWKGFALVFVGYEAVGSTKQLRLLIVTVATTAFVQGLDGIWQAITGTDFINNTPIWGGRLTGSLSTPRCGDYIAMILLPSLGFFILNRRTFPASTRFLLSFILLLPPLFLLVFAQSRSSYLAFLAGTYLLYVTFRKRLNPLMLLAPPIAITLLVLFGPSRISLEAILSNPRFDLWRLAWEIFKAYPLLGAGAGTYNPAFKSLGLLPAYEHHFIPHPHNIYFQFLSDTGMIGTAIALAFFATTTVWTACRIRRGLRSGNDEQRQHYRLTAFIWGGWVSYLVNALSAHDFYRTWWLAVAMTLLGALLGAVSISQNRNPQ